MAIELKITLPDSLAREADAQALLNPQAIQQLTQTEIRRRRTDSLFEAADRLSSLGGSPLSANDYRSRNQSCTGGPADIS